nr:DUF342 domain-containing protein [Desulfobacula sp.]
MGKFKPKLILLEADDAVRDHAKAVLTKAGWDVFCHQASRDALDMLEQSKEYLFALFISNFKLPKMEGDDILEKVKSISPVTRRMLIVPFDRADILINAVNKAEIHACITFPFKDEDLVAQAGNCFKQFKTVLKRQRLKRVTTHQNKQMLKIAQKLKKKDEINKELIDLKKAKKLTLTARLGKTTHLHKLDQQAGLSSVLEKKGIPASPETFKNEFLLIFHIFKDLFDKIALRRQSGPLSMDLKDIPALEKAGDDSLENGSASLDFEEKILNDLFVYLMTRAGEPQEPLPESDDIGTESVDHPLDPYFGITATEARTKAYIEKIKDFDDFVSPPTTADLLDLLRQKQISYGIIEDADIEAWISASCSGKILIAQGEKPVYGQDGKIEYYFKTDFTNPGKINEDGSIDFRERGNIPYVMKGDLLARKTPPKEGRVGVTVTGHPLPVDEVADPVFIAGSGTEFAEDSLVIRAVLDGQPHRDALGTVSINPDLIVPGDVDFETGNIDFRGNIIVKGMIKEGFTVKGINLTAKEVEGAVIELSGDLNISAGITNSKISAQGHIYAKYINHSTIKGFQNLIIQKEIIDSDILLSGSCKNPTGHIISSRISAKLGIEAGKIGTPSSSPCKLKIGVDSHIETLKKEMDASIADSIKTSDLLKNELKKLEDQDQALYREISEKAHIQDRAQVEIKELKKTLPDLQKLNDAKKLQEAASAIQKLADLAKAAEKALNVIFDTQDKLAGRTEQLKAAINRAEEKNKTLVLEKQALADFSKKDEPSPVLTVAKTIMADTFVKGPQTFLALKEDKARCRIQEISVNEDHMNYHEMMISDL